MSDESNAFITTLSDRLIEYAGICGCAYGAGLMRQAAAQIGERDAARNMYSEICTLRTRISTLRKRLEIDRMTVYDIKGGEIVGQREVECEDDDFDTDGIACRDATIGLLEETRDTLRAQIESLTRDVEKYQKRAFVTTGIIDTLRAELVAERAITDSTVSTLRSIGLSNFAKEIQGYIDTARSRGETDGRFAGQPKVPHHER